MMNSKCRKLLLERMRMCKKMVMVLLYVNAASQYGYCMKLLSSGTSISCANEGQVVHVPIISNNPCYQCKCVSGRVECEKKHCARKASHHDNQCTLSGDPLVLRQFDGNHMDYSGNCNYVLTRDCINRSFVVHLVNDNRRRKLDNVTGTTVNHRQASASAGEHHPVYTSNVIIRKRPNSSDYAIGYNTVFVRIGHNRIRISDAGKLVRVNNKPVRIPYIQLGHFTVTNAMHNKRSAVIVRSNNGLRIIWNGRDLNVIIPKYFRGNVCGLCGNDNGLKDDDLLTKRGLLAANTERFFRSWRVGRRHYHHHRYTNQHSQDDSWRSNSKYMLDIYNKMIAENTHTNEFD